MTTRVRLAMDYRPALLQSSGIGRAVRELARALSRRPDVELHLFGHSLARARRHDRVPAGAHLHRLPIPGRSLPWLAHRGWPTDRLCRKVPLFHWTDYVFPPVAPAIPVVMTLHDVAFAEDQAFHGPAQSAELSARTKLAIDRAALVVTPTHSTATAARERFGIAQERLRVVPFGVDHAHRTGSHPARHPFDGRPFILSLGTIEPRKNHLRLLEAWRGMGRDRPLLVVIGRLGWESAETARTLRRIREQGQLVWLEDADDSLTRACLSYASLLAYPSLLEGFGFPPLEACALGTPVLAGHTPALREVLDTAARFCDPRDVDSIRAGLLSVHTDASLRQELIARGRDRAAEFSWERCAAAHVAIYREAVA